MRVLTLADNCIDVYYQINRFYVTGYALEVAMNLARQGGCQVSLLTIWGNDVFATIAQELLDLYYIDRDFCLQGQKATAIATMMLIHGERFHAHWEENVLADFNMDEERLNYAKEFDIICSEHYTHGLLKYIPALAGKDRLLVHAFKKNTAGETVDRLLPCINYSFFTWPHYNEEVKAFLAEKKKLTKGMVFAMMGEEGSLGYDGNRFYYQPAIPVRIVNTVGAGAAYVSGFVQGLCQGENIEECMHRGAVQASVIVQQFVPY